MKWETIDTAPRNGTTIIIYGTAPVNNYEFYEIVFWNDDEQLWLSRGGDFGVRPELATHWTKFEPFNDGASE